MSELAPLHNGPYAASVLVGSGQLQPWDLSVEQMLPAAEGIKRKVGMRNPGPLIGPDKG